MLLICLGLMCGHGHLLGLPLNISEADVDDVTEGQHYGTEADTTGKNGVEAPAAWATAPGSTWTSLPHSHAS